MTAVDLRDIRIAARQRLLQTPDMVDESKIFGENQAGEHPPGELHIEEHMTIFDESHFASDTLMTEGRFRYNVFWPVGKGTREPEELAKKIADTFNPKNSNLQGAIHGVDVYRTERGSGSQWDDSWYYIPVYVFWRAFSST